MALMSLKLWNIFDLAIPFLVILAVQSVVLAIFTYYVTFKVMGRNYDAAVIAVSTGFISIICFNFVPSGVIFSCSGTFQGVGNAWPSLWSSATRLVTFAVPLMWLTTQPDFHIEQVWYLSVATVGIQTVLSLFFVRRMLKKQLKLQELVGV